MQGTVESGIAVDTERAGGQMKKTQWMVQTKKADFDGIGQAFHISPVTARIIRNRDVVGMEPPLIRK